jgi:hypothetical protein
MIQANELRIGNFVLAKGEWIEIFSITEDGSGGYGYNSLQGGMPNFYSCDPISLTPEILERCGLKNDDGYYHNEDYSFSIEERGNEYFYEYDGRNIGKGCKYLHQLQNLYFALTSEELEVKFYVE